MKKPLLDELLASGNVEAIKVADEGNMLYFENQKDSNRHVKVVTSAIIRQPDPKPDNQNPTLKISAFEGMYTADACLLKGSLLSQGQFIALDQVAHESALPFITKGEERLAFGDYTTSVDAITGVRFTFNHGITGNRYAIAGFVPTNFDLKDLSKLPNQNSAIIQMGSVSWTANQLRSTLVYTQAGIPVIPVYFKFGMTATAIANQSFNTSDVSGAFGNYTGQAKTEFSFDWDGLDADAVYSTNTKQMIVSSVFKRLTTSAITPIVMSAPLYAAFVQKGLIDDTKVNPTFKDASVTGTINAWSMTGNVPTPQAARPLVTFAWELPKNAYDQLAVLQWTKPNLEVLKLGDRTFTVEQVMMQTMPYQQKYYMPYPITYDVDLGVDRTVNATYGWNGIVLNNEWSIETVKLTQLISVVTDPFKYATPATAFMITDPTAPITVIVNGVEQTFVNYYAFLASNVMEKGREAGLVLLTKNS